MCFRHPFDELKCGKCPECLEETRLEWTLRVQLHYYITKEKPFFAHFTYDNEHVPVNEYGNLTLCKRDFQLFIKRLRAYVKKKYQKTIKYYCAGEYGPHGTHRPHYHCLFFGFPSDLEKDKVISILQKNWDLGFVRHRSDWLKDYSQIHYCTKYMINYFNEDFSKKVAPFKLCSCGIGKPFIDFARDRDLYNYRIQNLFKCDCRLDRYNNKIPVKWYFEMPYWYDNDDNCIKFNPLLVNFRDYIEFSDNNHDNKVYRYPLPRYFKEKLYTEDFRIALREYKKMKARIKRDVYLNENNFDIDNEIPMWLQLKRYKWERKKKNKKDKNLKVSLINVLNE